MSELFEGEPRQIGDYRIVEEIARGGMGTVYRAVDPALDREVAIKVLHRRDPDALRRFDREARIAARLRHEHIVPIHAVGDGWLVMPLIDGVTLAEGARGRALRERVAMLLPVADAVGYAHAEGVVHRDLKPQNVLVERGTGKVYLTDFGLARALDAETLTASGAHLGTPAYMAPEQVRAQRELVGPATDVWALGVMLYELVGGARPFESPHAIEHEAPPELLNAPPELRAIWCRALAKEPADRYPEGSAFAADLQRYLAGEPIRDVRAPAGVSPPRTETAVPPRLPDPAPGGILCPTCGYSGVPTREGWGVGSCLVMIVLLAAGFFPGVIYFFLRQREAATVLCPRCRSATVVRGRTPVSTWIGAAVLILLGLVAIGAIAWKAFLDTPMERARFFRWIKY